MGLGPNDTIIALISGGGSALLRAPAVGLTLDDKIALNRQLLASGARPRCGDAVGGPNAEFVLAAMLELNGREGIHVLTCDTDGVDGAAEVAGAYAGPDSTGRAKAQGPDPADALARNDAHGFFGAIGGQVVTGPTLTNVNDFRAFLIFPAP